MKYKLIQTIIIILPFLAISQEKLNKLQTPTSPASSILGLQPSIVLSPKSYQALEASLYSNFINKSGNGYIPNDFALEFTPYWTKNHKLSLKEYLFPENKFDQFVRNSSFSIASTQNFLLGDSTATNSISFGYRTTFYFGNNKDREEVINFTDSLMHNMKISAKIAIKEMELFDNKKISNQDEFMKIMKSIIFKAIYDSGRYDNMDEALMLTTSIIESATLIPPLDVKAPEEFIDSLNKIIDKKLFSENIFNRFKEYIKERYGLSTDIAYANLFNFPTNNFESSYVPRQSFWITPTYRFKDKWSFLKIMGVLRYEWYNTDYYKKYFVNIKIYENNIDYGISVGGVFKKFSLNFELVGRKSNSVIPAGKDIDGNDLFRKEKKSDFQYIGSYNYNLTDQIVLSYSLGNRFKIIQNPTNTLISILSLNFGFGSPTKKDIDLEK